MVADSAARFRPPRIGGTSRRSSMGVEVGVSERIEGTDTEIKQRVTKAIR